MFCPKCGNQVQPQDAFCGKCGGRLTPSPDAPAEKPCLTEAEKKAEEMTRHCMEHYDWAPKGTLRENIVRKNEERSLRCYFRAIEREIQADERELLCFAGMHGYKSQMWDLGGYGYVLTNRRLIMAGALGSAADCLNYYHFMKAACSKNFACRLKSLYLKDLKQVSEAMMSGKDVIRFETTDKTFNVMFRGSNITHSLCDKINTILASLREEA